MPTVEERLAVIETIGNEVAKSLVLRQIEVDRRLGAIEAKLDSVVEVTNRHVFKATCINGGAKILQGGGAASGVVAVIILLGKVVGWW